MLFVWGRGEYGRIDEHGNEHACTVFFHAWGVPLVPLASYWMSLEAGRPTATQIPLCGRSIAAGYARVAAPAIALGALLLAPLIGLEVALPLAVPLLAACAWSLRWRSLRGDRARRRSDFQLLAFGTRCAPMRMGPDQRVRAKHALDERWSELAGGRSPEDVAQHGAASADEAVIAYGRLVLVALELRGDARRSTRDTAERILDGAYDVRVDDGPYRAAREVAPSHAIAADVASTAAAVSEVRSTRPPVERVARGPLPPRRAWWLPSRSNIIAVVAATLLGLGGIAANVGDLRSPQPISASELVSAPPIDRRVELRCDELDLRGQLTIGTKQRIPMPYYSCNVGSVAVVVFGPNGNGGEQVVVKGRLRELEDGHHAWPAAMRQAPFVSVYVDTDLGQGRAAAWLGVVLVGASIAILLAWLVHATRRRSQRH